MVRWPGRASEDNCYYSLLLLIHFLIQICFLLFAICYFALGDKQEKPFFQDIFYKCFQTESFFKLSQLFFFTRSHKCIFFPSLKPSSPHMFSQIVKKKKKKIPTSSQVINTGEKTIYFRLKNLITLKKMSLFAPQDLLSMGVSRK